jgi:hypothetical protein
MESFMDFVFSTGTEIYRSSGDFSGILIIGLMFVFSVMVARKGFAGWGFWGKERRKIAEYMYERGDRTKRTFIYRLSSKSGYQGYGLEFTDMKFKLRTGGTRMKSGGSVIEFTKQEADRLIDLIKPHLRNESVKGQNTV